MLISWRDQTSHTIEDAMNTVGEIYRRIFLNNEGLSASKKNDLPFSSRVIR
ncbi:hypothetical protein [Paenibacillus spongiae]|uniref:hypothetical protein n=1 Tax=Paenibacillus spongiae TaxID=2909671 RepID=UPI0035A234C2